MIKDDDLLSKCNTNWNKTSADSKIEVNSKTVYNKIFFKTQTKFCGDECTNFSDEVLKIDPSYTCLAKISLNSIFRWKLLHASCIKRMLVNWKMWLVYYQRP